MGKRKPVILALLAGTTLACQGVAVADNGGVAARHATIPSANRGPAAIPSLGPVGLPAGAMGAKTAPGQIAGSGSSAQTAAPGAARSASSAGLTPPGQGNQPNRGASDNKSGDAKEDLATLTGASTDAASTSQTSVDQLPTCR